VLPIGRTGIRLRSAEPVRMTVNCKRCGAPVPAEKRECQACGEDNGYPNVRLAQVPAEVDMLAKRLHDAEVSATARGCSDTLERFGVAVLGSKAVIARSLAVVQDLIETDRRTYTSFHKQLAAGARVAEENQLDQVRTQIEAAFFPNFYKEIVFAFLSLGATTLRGYGAYAIVLKTDLIGHRATVFEENLLTFSKKMRLMLHDPIPAGYRAVWSERHTLAKAKLHSELNADSADAAFPSILVKDRGGTADSDFVEVHIYGPLNRHTIERIIGPRPRTREDRLIWRQLERQLAKISVPVETL
jgi:hypothetical protein